MKRRLSIVIAVILVLSLALAACGGKQAPAPAAPAEPAAPADPATPAPAEPLEVIELTLMNHEGPNSVTAAMLDKWCAAVLEESGGALIVTPFHGSLGGPRDTYNMVMDGSVDIGFGLPTFYPGVFPATEVIGLPFIGAQNSMQAGHAMQELWDTTDVIRNEWNDVHSILQCTNTLSPLFTRDKKIMSVNDLKGMNIRTVGAPVTEWAKIVGANPMPVDLGEVYTSFEKGVINAITSVGWEAVESTSVWELGKYFLDFEMQVNPTFIVMNLDSWNRLPDTHKAFLDACSGHNAIEIMGDDREVSRARVAGKIRDKSPDNLIYRLDDLDPAEVQKFKDAGYKARDVWRGQVDALGAGIDTKALEEAATALMEKWVKEYYYEF